MSYKYQKLIFFFLLLLFVLVVPETITIQQHLSTLLNSMAIYTAFLEQLPTM